MKKVYRLTESELITLIKKSIINEDNSKENIRNIQKALKSKGTQYASLLGTSGPNRDGVDGVFGNNTENAIKKFQLDNDLEPVGYVGPKTAQLLGVNQMDKPTGTTSGQGTSGGRTGGNDGECKATPAQCKKLSSTSNVTIGSTSTTGCAKWARQELEKLGASGISGNAWEWLGKLKSGEKFNIYPTSVNWQNIFGLLKKKGITLSVLSGCQGDDSDKKTGCSTVANIITNSMPATSSFNMSDLKVGDAVGLYHKDSSNKSVAFSQKAVKTGARTDNQGYLLPNTNNLFTFNSHVGYVGAIKDGVPIIFHNVHQTLHATPATKLTSKNGSDMIVWVASTGASDGSYDAPIRSIWRKIFS